MMFLVLLVVFMSSIFFVGYAAAAYDEEMNGR